MYYYLNDIYAYIYKAGFISIGFYYAKPLTQCKQYSHLHQTQVFALLNDAAEK